jgi:hypothetical protein
MSSHKKGRKSKRRKRTSLSPPDLSLIVEALWDAYGLVWTANEVIPQGDYKLCCSKA